VHAQAWGQMTALRGNDIVLAPLADTGGRTRPVDLHLFRDVASVFFG